MGRTYETIDEKLTAFIQKQPMFFVATSPLSGEGNINLSPKGLDSFRILDSRTVAYADLIGSGIETVAHLKENGRIVVMFCAFEGAPNILRLHGRGEVIEPGHLEFGALKDSFPTYRALRAIIRIRCTRISDSCGFGVPRMDYREERSQLIRWADQKGPDELAEYQRTTNDRSIDGLDGISPPGSGH